MSPVPANANANANAVGDRAKKVGGIILVALVLTAGGYAAGRFSAPDRVVTVEHTVTVTREDTQARKQVRALTAQLETLKRDTHRVEVTVTMPNGKKTTRTVVDTHVAQDRAESTDVQAAHEEAKHVEQTHEVTRENTVERERPAWRIGPMVSLTPSTGKLSYGAQVERRILGPLSLGAWGLSSGQFGLSLTLEF